MPELRHTLRRLRPALAGVALTVGSVVGPVVPAFADQPEPPGRYVQGEHGYGYGRYDRFTDPYRYEPSDQACYPAIGGVYLGQTYEEADTGVYLADFFPAN